MKRKFLKVVFFILVAICVIPNQVQAKDDDNTVKVSDFNKLESVINDSSSDGLLTNIIVTEDIQIYKTLIIREGQNIKITSEPEKRVRLIHKMNTDKSIVKINKNADFTLGEDYQGNENITIDGNDSGSGALIYNEGNFYLNSGTITGATGILESTTGGGVFNSGFFEMNSGVIRDNKAYPYSGANGGGGVFNIGQFNMNGGSISNNFAGEPYRGDLGVGGGVFVRQGNFIINGGIIHDNIAGSGGGIYVYGISNIPTQYGKVTLNQALITKNTASLQGGGTLAMSNWSFIFLSK